MPRPRAKRVQEQKASSTRTGEMLHVASELSCIGEVSYAPYDQPPLSKENQDPEKRGWWRLGPTHDEETRVS
jgi:hypothetical protein